MNRILERLAAADPGAARLRTALAATLCMGVALAVIDLLARLVVPDQNTLMPVLVGGVAAMQCSGALLQPTVRGRLRAAARLAPAAPIALCLVVGLREAGTGVMLAGIVVVTFVAVLVRRFGPEFAVAGLMGWVGYYLGIVLAPTPADLPVLAPAQAVGVLCALLTSVVALPHRPRHGLRHALRGVSARSTALARSATRALDRPATARHRRRMLDRHATLATGCLIVEGWLADTSAGSGAGQAVVLRQRVMDVQSAADAVVHAVDDLAAHAVDHSPPLRTGRAAVTAILAMVGAGDAGGAVRAAQAYLAESGTSTAGDGERDVAAAVVELGRALIVLRGPFASPGNPLPFTPVVRLAAGALPGSAAVAARQGVGPGLPLRQAVQATVAMALALLCAWPLSETQYPWALIAVFIVFLGPVTRGELLVKGYHRILGTVLGVLVAVPVSALLSGHTVAIVVLVLAACFLGHHLMTVSYAALMFAITVCVLLLYDVMGRSGPQLAELRVAETAIGAVLAMAVALTVLPVGTRATARIAHDALLRSVGALLDAVARHIEAGPGEPAELRHLARQVDEHARQLRVVSIPLLRRAPGRRSPCPVDATLHHSTRTASHLRLLANAVHRGNHALPHGSAPTLRALASSSVALAGATSWPAPPPVGSPAPTDLPRRPARAQAGPGAARDAAHHLEGVREALAALGAAPPIHAQAAPDAPTVSGISPVGASDAPSGAVVHGVVLDADGAPVATATVLLLHLGASTASATTGPDGCYRLGLDVAGDPGYRTVVAVSQEHGAAAEWVLPRPGRDVVADLKLHARVVPGQVA